MHIGDLKRAVEDVVLRPDDNRLSDMEERSTIAALDLCQLGKAQGTLPRMSTSSEIERQRTTTTLTSSSYSGEMLASSTESTCSTSVTTSSGHVPSVPSAPPISMSTSLDTMVLRQTLFSRPSLGTSRRSSRVIPHFSHNKRKRSNSVSSCMNKGLLIHHGVASTAGVSATTTGGASALSLPPTARHTPFRFGDFDEHSYSTRSTSGDNPSPIPHTANLTEPMLGIRIQQQPLLSEEWTKICKERENDPRQQKSSKFEDTMIANQQTTNNCAPKLFPVSSFTTFREAHKAYDSDNEEQMECD
ncbi:unnamed protein product [Onchocerca ochengi]|uniref:Uncharacterized protein n=2 Tax=Onchocerca ochengi TaxID=42157 RepID=A0A182EM00_ONCOC|nr:unnamed protein product [Onchocerca ochengi]